MKTRSLYQLLEGSTPSSLSRRHFVLFLLIGTTVFLLGSLYTCLGNPFDRTLVVPPTIKIEIGPRPESGGPDEVHYLWSYVTGIDTPGRRQTWDWVAGQRREGYRRPSWGALRAQGAKAHVRDNLQPGKKYLTSHPVAGWNNEVMDIINMIAIALRSNRIPLVAPFWPDTRHLLHEAVYLSVSEVFDLSDLVAHYGVPIVDMFELKVGPNVDERHRLALYDGEHPREDVRVGQRIRAEEPSMDTVKCWNTYLTVTESPGGYGTPVQPVEVEMTPLPLYVYGNASKPTFTRISLPLIAQAIAAYSSPSDILPTDSVARLVELGRPPSTMSPDDPFTCINQVFYACFHPESEGMTAEYKQGIGAWEEVGRFLRFQPGLETIAQDLLRGLIGIGKGQAVPPYAAVHIRRTDFAQWYMDLTQANYAHQAWLLLREASIDRGLDIKHVVFTTDEEDDDWLDVLRAMGWVHINHAVVRTGERLGWWYPTLLDSIILSSAEVFLGVAGSTMSMLPYRRVLDQGGIAGFVTKDPIPQGWEWSSEW